MLTRISLDDDAGPRSQPHDKRGRGKSAAVIRSRLYDDGTSKVDGVRVAREAREWGGIVVSTTNGASRHVHLGARPCRRMSQLAKLSDHALKTAGAQDEGRVL
jgi:hypothetical protein